MNPRNKHESKAVSSALSIALLGVALTTLAVVSVGCHDDGAVDSTDATEATSSTSTYPSRAEPSQRAEVTVPEGRLLEVRFADALSSKDTVPGTRFEAELTEAVMVDGAVAIPEGAQISGTVVEVNKANSFGGMASLNLHFDQLLIGDRTIPIDAGLYSEERGEKKKDAARIGGGALGGAIIGHLLDDDDGAETGAAAGAVIGTVIAGTTKGEDVQIAVGAPAHLRLTRSVTL